MTTTAPHIPSPAPTGAPRGRSSFIVPTSSFSSLYTLYTLTLRQHLRGRRWLVTSALFLLPAALAVVIRATARDVPLVGLEFIFAFMFIPQALLPLAALLYASGLIQDEQEEQTITYLLIRPIPKFALYLVKLAATLTTTVALTVLFTFITYAALYVGSTSGANGVPPEILARAAKAAAIHSLAIASYCCLFGLISLLTRRTLIVGIIYAAVVEGLFANLPLSIRLTTVIYHARIIAYRTMEFLVPIPGAVQDFAAEAWQLNTRTDPQLLEHPAIRTSLLTLLLAGLAFSLLAAYLCSRREFHVKTPEKSEA
jgi:ABC-2 type transport system permease protein